MWCGECPLKVAFPKLFNICLNMESLVAELMQLSNGVTHWDIHFSRLVQDWELESLVKFMEPNLFQVGEDEGSYKLCWRPAKRRGFEVRGYYQSLSSSYGMAFMWKLVLRLYIPPRALLFLDCCLREDFFYI